MIADIFLPYIHPNNHHFSKFYFKKVAWGFHSPTFTKSSPWIPSGAYSSNRFWFWPKTDASIFCLFYVVVNMRSIQDKELGSKGVGSDIN